MNIHLLQLKQLQMMQFSDIQCGEEEMKSARRIVLTTGVFHILHPGHIELFEYCASLGSVIVGINSDMYVKNKSGKILIPLIDRIYTLKSIKYVDHVVVFNEEDASDLIRKIRPYYFVKGPDYIGKHIPEEQMCRETGTTYMVTGQTKKYNSSELLNFNEQSIKNN